MPALKELPTRFGPEGSGPGWQLFDPGGGRRLDELVCTVWEQATAGEVTSCLVCDGPVEPAQDGGALECPACGSSLS